MQMKYMYLPHVTWQYPAGSPATGVVMKVALHFPNAACKLQQLVSVLFNQQ